MDAVYTTPTHEDTNNIMSIEEITPMSEQPTRRRRTRTNPPVADHPAVNFRVPEDVWANFGDASRALGWNRSEALRYFIAWFTWTPGAPKPIRPRYEQLTDPELHPQDMQELQGGAA